MTLPLRLALVAITVAMLVTALVRGTPEGRMMTARLLGPDLERVELLGLSVQPRFTPATLTERARADLTPAAPPAGAERLYVPDLDQGTEYVTRSGLTWWGAGPAEGEPAPVVVLLHDAGDDGRGMVDMWHEVADRAGLVLVAPEFGQTVDPETGLYDARVAVEALRQAGEIFAIDESRVTLFGHGKGAEVAQLWANRIDGPWRAVAAHSGIVALDAPLPVLHAVPVRHYIGTEDATRPIGDAIAAGTAMARAGHPYELIRMRGHDNWFWGAGEGIAEDAWLWLEAQMGPPLARR